MKRLRVVDHVGFAVGVLQRLLLGRVDRRQPDHPVTIHSTGRYRCHSRCQNRADCWPNTGQGCRKRKPTPAWYSGSIFRRAHEDADSAKPALNGWRECLAMRDRRAMGFARVARS